ncbi:MAG: glucose-6-phosphate dehydrogenase [Polyangiaceae bacterium]
MTALASDALIFFGATGDLAEKQIWPALAALSKAGRLEMPVIAIGRKAIGKAGIVEKLKASLDANKVFEAATFERLCDRLGYVAVDYDKPETFDAIKQAIGKAECPLSYVALPPDLFEKVSSNLEHAGLAKGGRLVLEKPFGHDAESARALSAALYRFFPEESIFRIDHYLGKEQLENIVYFRAANPLFEAAWGAEHVEWVELTMSEQFGVEGRAEFYDAVGAVRDVVQSHLLEVVACLAMELPENRSHAALRHARTTLISQVKELAESDFVRGQVRGYLKEKGVAKDSKTETYAALRLFIDSGRWQGVPFYVRTGKNLAVSATEARVRFKPATHPVLDEQSPPPPVSMRFRLSPGDAVTLSVNVKRPGEEMVGEPAELALSRPASGRMKPYERLLGDALSGDASLYAEREAVEQAWRVFDGALKAPIAVYEYDDGTWGPREADRVGPEGGWDNPVP